MLVPSPSPFIKVYGIAEKIFSKSFKKARGKNHGLII